MNRRKTNCTSVRQSSRRSQIGELTVPVNWLEKTAVMTLEQRRALVEPGTRELSIVQQCEVLEIHRSGFYQKPSLMQEEDLRIMRLMDELHLEYPFRGARRLVHEPRDLGAEANRDQVRLLRQAVRIKESWSQATEQRYGFHRTVRWRKEKV